MGFREYLLTRSRSANNNNRFKMFLDDSLDYLIKNCNLISYNTPTTDKVGKSSRTAVRGKALVGDGATYGTVDFVTNDLYDIELITTGALVGQYLLDFRFNGGIGSVRYNSSAILVASSGVVTSDILPDGTYLEKVVGIQITSTVMYLLSHYTVGDEYSGNLLSLKLTNQSDGEVFTINFESRQDDGLIPFNNSGEPIMVEQFLSPAIATINSNIGSEQDESDKGVTFVKALGKNKFNKELGLLGFFLNSSGVASPSGSGTGISDFTLVEPSTTYYISGFSVSLANQCYYDKDKNFISLDASTNLLTTPSNCMYIRLTIPSFATAKEAAQLELGTVPTAYEAYKGYSFDILGLIPIQDGTPILGNNAYTIDGRITAEHKGRIKHDKRVVDGVVDYDTDKYTVLDAGASIVDDKLQIISNGVSFVDAMYDIVLDESTEYTIVWDIEVNTTTVLSQFVSVENTGFNDGARQYFPLATTGEFRQKFTTLATITAPYIHTFTRTGAPNGEIIKASFKIYKGDKLIGTLPTHAIYESGNSITPDQVYDGSPNDGVFKIANVNQVVPFDDLANISYQQVYVSEDKQKILTFAEPLVRHSDCDSKARRFVDINEQLYVQIGTTGEYEPFLVDGEKFMVLKENASKVVE